MLVCTNIIEIHDKSHQESDVYVFEPVRTSSGPMYAQSIAYTDHNGQCWAICSVFAMVGTPNDSRFGRKVSHHSVPF